MDESSFEKRLNQFDPSLWLARRPDGNGWNIMGVDARRQIYVALGPIPIGNLGEHIIQNLWRHSPHRNQQNPSEVADMLDAKTDKVNEERRRSSMEFIEDFANDCGSRLQWSRGSRIVNAGVPCNGFVVKDRRRDFEEVTCR